MNAGRLGTLVLAMLVVDGCKKDDPPPDTQPEHCDVAAQTGCEVGAVCEQVVGGDPDCFAPLSVRGLVFDTVDDGPIEGALVVARDANGAAVSTVAVTDVDGGYELRVPAPRDADGSPVAGTQYTLRADAAAYLTFPAAPRTALPIDLSTAAGEPPSVQSAATDVGLIPLPDASDLGTVSGMVQAELPGGTLVVAGGSTGIADADGAFTVFNIPSGPVEVNGYKAGLQLDSASVDVAAGQVTADVVLTAIGEATATVSGSVQIVNAPGDSATSVILVVEDTFDDLALRGEAPPGFRVGDITGEWSLVGIPQGRYVVLAAFENDDLVRDPDTSIGGTDIVHLEVTGADEVVEGFKVTEALGVHGPGATLAEEVTAPLTLTFDDDSSEDEYVVEVFDALGTLVWDTSGDFDPGGSAPVEIAYDGPLDPGMYYQFRATSLKAGVPLSTTEDLKGVFFVAAELP